MNYKEALKRLKQETCPCTYNPDFDKDECLKIIKNELNKYKSAEKELGIDLITFVKLQKTYKIYDKEEEGFMDFNYIDFEEKRLVCVDDWDEMSYTTVEYYYYFKDYGKKWALTEEELKKQWQKKEMI